METKEDWWNNAKVKTDQDSSSVVAKGETKSEEPPKVESSPTLEDQKPKKMCLRALDIQIKLFGYTSILLPRKNWLEFVWK